MAESWSELSDRISHSPPLWTFAEEDVRPTLEYTKNVITGARVLCIASGGEVALSMALRGARDLTVIDIGAAQLGVAQLKVSSVQQLTFDQVRTLWLTKSIDERASLLRVVAGLDDKSDLGWLASSKSLIDAGLMQGVGSEVASREDDLLSTGIDLCRCTDLNGQRSLLGSDAGRFLIETISELRQQRAEQYFGAPDDGQASDKSIRDEMKAAFAERFLFCLSRHLARDNEFVQHQVFGRFLSQQPQTFDPALFAEVKSAVTAARWRFVESPIERLLPSLDEASFDCIYLSNVTDLMTADQATDLLDLASRALKPGGVVCHRSLIRPRLPDNPASLGRDAHACADLLARDRSFLYSGISVDRKRS